MKRVYYDRHFESIENQSETIVAAIVWFLAAVAVVFLLFNAMASEGGRYVGLSEYQMQNSKSAVNRGFVPRADTDPGVVPLQGNQPKSGASAGSPDRQAHAIDDRAKGF